MTNTPYLTIEWAFGIAMSLAITALWRYVDSQAKTDKELAAEVKTLSHQINEGEKHYQSRSEAKQERGEIMALLKEIKADLKDINGKLDKKADKA